MGRGTSERATGEGEGMKKQKQVEITVCDFCKQEKETRPCATCHADACNSCSMRVDVHVTRWRESKEYMYATVFTGGQGDPALSGFFCSQCSPESMLQSVGFVKREKAA